MSLCDAEVAITSCLDLINRRKSNATKREGEFESRKSGGGENKTGKRNEREEQAKQSVRFPSFPTFPPICIRDKDLDGVFRILYPNPPSPRHPMVLKEGRVVRVTHGFFYVLTFYSTTRVFTCCTSFCTYVPLLLNLQRM